MGNMKAVANVGKQVVVVGWEQLVMDLEKLTTQLMFLMVGNSGELEFPWLDLVALNIAYCFSFDCWNLWSSPYQLAQEHKQQGLPID
jgi:hypothetical protein